MNEGGFYGKLHPMEVEDLVRKEMAKVPQTTNLIVSHSEAGRMSFEMYLDSQSIQRNKEERKRIRAEIQMIEEGIRVIEEKVNSLNPKSVQFKIAQKIVDAYYDFLFKKEGKKSARLVQKREYLIREDNAITEEIESIKSRVERTKIQMLEKSLYARSN